MTHNQCKSLKPHGKAFIGFLSCSCCCEGMLVCWIVEEIVRKVTKSWDIVGGGRHTVIYETLTCRLFPKKVCFKCHTEYWLDVNVVKSQTPLFVFQNQCGILYTLHLSQQVDVLHWFITVKLRSINPFVICWSSVRHNWGFICSYQWSHWVIDENTQ